MTTTLTKQELEYTKKRLESKVYLSKREYILLKRITILLTK